MYFCCIKENDDSGTVYEQFQLKLPIIPRLGEYLQVGLPLGDVVEGKVTRVMMACSLDETDEIAAGGNIAPEAKKIVFYITVTREEPHRGIVK